MRKLTAVFLLLALLSAACPAFMESTEDAGFTLMAESQSLQLLLNEKTMEARIRDKRSGAVADSQEMDGKQGNKTIKNLQKAMLNVTYIANEKSGTVSSMDSYSLGVKMDGVKAMPVENGFEVQYEIGDDALTIDNLPKIIPVEKYNELLLPYWKSKDEDDFRDHYRVVSNVNAWVRIKDDGMGALILKKLWGMLFETGKYTYDDLLEDNASYNYEMTKLNPKIRITVRFQLDGDDLLVTVPTSAIEAPEDHQLTVFELLPYFMTGTQEQTGYLFVPDGTGSLIRLNNQKTVATSYIAQVYGSDILKNVSTYSPEKYNVMLPVYGVKTDDTAILAIIERGAELSEIVADISGRADEFNRVGSRFILRDVENVAIISNTSISMPKYSDDVYQGDIVIRYKFLSGADASYTGMAKAYREHLLDNGSLVAHAPEEKAPFFLEVVGAVKKEKFFLGIPYPSSVQATTIGQAGEIYQAIRDAGVENIKLLFSGLYAGGVKHASLTNVSLDGGMGGKSALLSLQNTLAQNGDTLFPSIYLGRAYGNRNFSKTTQAARLRNGDIASVVVYGEPILKRTRNASSDSSYISVHYLPDYIKNVRRALSSWEVPALNVRDLGAVLAPDYKRNANISRVHATPIYEDALAQLSGDYPLMLDIPNAYALKYAQYATNLPSDNNGYKVEDEAIPFLQMVLHGCVSYSGESWNMQSYRGIQDQLLFALESKSAPRFTLTYQQPTIFDNTQDKDYMAYFATQYQAWVSECAAVYKTWSDYYQAVKDAQILSHDILESGLRRVLYDNGVALYVNYADTAQTCDGLEVPAHDFVLEGGL